METLKVFADKEELKEFKKQMEVAQTTPVIAFSMAQGLAGRDLSSMAWQRLHENVHASALKHGLPEIEGFYGIDLVTGEFNKA